MILFVRIFFLSILFLFFQSNAFAQEIVSDDIDRFWKAYDQIILEPDSSKQMEILEKEFLDPGSPGLGAIRFVRRYGASEYLDAIRNYPAFWNSLRKNTEQIPALTKSIHEGIENLRKLYPDLSPAKIYFTLGVFRTGGTTLDSMVLIGSELAMGDTSLNVSELPDRMQYVKDYYQQNPIGDIVFLNVHEFVHTQQKESMGASLLSTCLREGSAEYIAEMVTGQVSQTPAISEGPKKADAIRERFIKEMFSANYQSWLWSSLKNGFDIRDLGYYVGYAIVDKLMKQSDQPAAVVKTLIELDYLDEAAVAKVVDQSGYFPKPIEQLRQEIEAVRPTVVAVNPVDDENYLLPGSSVLTLKFSEPMDTRFRGFDLGPLGKDHVLSVQEIVGWSEDRMKFSYKIDLEKDRQYQVLITDNFRTTDGRPLVPYLVDVRTK